MTTAAAAEHDGPSRGRIIAARILVIVGVILTTISILAVFVKREALDEATFKQTSSELIANDEIRAEVAATMADALYANVDVSELLADKLPENLQGLAGPIAGLSQEYAARAADELLARPRVQTLFVEASSQAQKQFIDVLRGDTELLETSNGNVVLDLRPLVLRLGDRFNFVANLADKVPQDSAQVTIIASDDLDMAQRIVHWLELVANWIWIFALASWVAAFLLVKGRRREELRAIGIGLVVAGIVVLVVRSLAGGYFVDNVVKTDSVRPAAEQVWRIVTDGLAQAAWGVLILGLLAALGAWAAGPGRRATAFRSWIAPVLRRAELAWVAFAAGIVLLVWILPLNRLVVTTVLVVLAAIGYEVLRRQTAAEFPEGTGPDVVAGVKTRLAAPRSSRSTPASSASVSDELERLAALHADGKLTDEEYATAKSKLL
jgi:hypothetical protein